jgi:hypothetical protein
MMKMDWHYGRLKSPIDRILSWLDCEDAAGLLDRSVNGKIVFSIE